MGNTPLRVDPEPHWRLLGRRYRLILGLSVACALGATIFSLLQKKTYRASAYLLLSGSKIETGQTMIPNYVYYELLRSYEVFLLNDELIQATIEHFGLQSPPNSLTVDDFRKRKIIEVEWTKNTRLLEFSAEFPEPRLAAEIVNYYVLSTVRFNDELYARDLEKTRTLLKEQLNLFARQLESKRQRLNEFDQNSNPELSSQDLQALSELNLQNQRDLLQLEVERARVLARKVRFVQELEDVQSKAGPQDRGSGSSALGSNNESGNIENRLPELQRKIAESNAKIAETDGAIEVLRKSQERSRPELIRLQKERATKENLQRQLLDDYQAALDNYESFSWKYQDAATTVGSRSTDLKEIAAAIPPTKPYKPWIALNSILGGALGLLVSIPLSFLLHYMEKPAQTGTKQTE